MQKVYLSRGLLTAQCVCAALINKLGLETLEVVFLGIEFRVKVLGGSYCGLCLRSADRQAGARESRSGFPGDGGGHPVKVPQRDGDLPESLRARR